jgi:hypothetical protein
VRAAYKYGLENNILAATLVSLAWDLRLPGVIQKGNRADADKALRSYFAAHPRQ